MIPDRSPASLKDEELGLPLQQRARLVVELPQDPLGWKRPPFPGEDESVVAVGQDGHDGHVRAAVVLVLGERADLSVHLFVGLVSAEGDLT